MNRVDFAVIGAGVNGLSAAWALARRKAGRIALIERFDLGHDRGSSHGQSRITRSAYVDADYVRLMQVAHHEVWPALEAEAGERLIHPVPGAFFGPPGEPFDAYLRAADAATMAMERLSPAEARKRFPLLRFPQAETVLVDPSAGIVAAERTMRALARLVMDAGVEVRPRTPVERIEVHPSHVAVHTAQGIVECGKVIVTAGAWAGRLLPWLAPALHVARQTVGYFELDAPDSLQAPGLFPVWAWLAPDDGDGLRAYGLPVFGRPGIKLARHITHGADDDPDAVPDAIAPSALAALKTLVALLFDAPIRRLASWQTCLYTNTATSDPMLALHPDEPRIVIGAGFSGHGFKLGPLTGRVLADLAMEGECRLPAFLRARQRFAIAKG
ncbi:MAG: N-methyl-L-tryptophan oxidase [Myxococcales bacterium]|nr:N-methyl-L-tryptophan oxidase [Myxococcales bacterium]